MDASVPSPLYLAKVRSHSEFLARQTELAGIHLSREAFEKSLLPETAEPFSVPGYCFLCGRATIFNVSFRHSFMQDDRLRPIWRETLDCQACHFNNRMRAAVHVIELACRPEPDARIYMTEQTTPLYQWFEKKYPHLQGSEFLGDAVPRGSLNEKGWRNEDVTRLTFDDSQFDCILSFDVFEHIPDYLAALRQCFRCLKPGGSFLFSVPFSKWSGRNIVRARIEDGQVRHLLPPEYHGDPLSADGCLCYYHFGWEMLDEMRGLGFSDVQALLYWSPDYGYLGGEQIIFSATKPK